MSHIAEDLRRLIAQNQEMERRLHELQAALAGMRTDFETAIATRMRQLDATPHSISLPEMLIEG
jgi:ABC-type phosphate transport system auxiliary subunit